MMTPNSPPLPTQVCHDSCSSHKCWLWRHSIPCTTMWSVWLVASLVASPSRSFPKAGTALVCGGQRERPLSTLEHRQVKQSGSSTRQASHMPQRRQPASAPGCSVLPCVWTRDAPLEHFTMYASHYITSGPFYFDKLGDFFKRKNSPPPPPPLQSDNSEGSSERVDPSSMPWVYLYGVREGFWEIQMLPFTLLVHP